MNPEQTAAYAAAKAGRSVLITGASGVGKSFTIKAITQWLHRGNIPHGVTATTGCAALLLKGTTIHSFLGIGLANKPVSELVRDTTQKHQSRRHGKNQVSVYDRIMKLRCLIIDEISMMNDALFDTISAYLSALRSRPEPFGGIQLILCGDLYQIPPVTGKFFFCSSVWKQIQADMQVFDLKQAQRHSGDQVFARIVQKLRMGNCDSACLQALKATESNTFSGGIQPTILYTKNIDVDVINKHELGKLVDAGAPSKEYFMQTSSSLAGKAWASSCKVPESVILCEGAQVMLTWNLDLDKMLCNGSRGVVIELTNDGVLVQFKGAQTPTMIPSVRIEHPDNKDIWITYMPLKLAYALTVNKSQGATLDAAVIDMDIGYTSADFIYGKFYTAVSRVRSLDSIIIRNAQKRLFIAHPDVKQFYASEVAEDKLSVLHLDDKVI